MLLICERVGRVRLLLLWHAYAYCHCPTSFVMRLHDDIGFLLRFCCPLSRGVLSVGLSSFHPLEYGSDLDLSVKKRREEKKKGD